MSRSPRNTVTGRGILLAFSALLIACAKPSAPEFAIRDLHMASEESEFFTSFTLRGTVVQIAPATPQQTSAVIVRLVRVSGGPDSFRSWGDTTDEIVMLRAGVGSIVFGIGSRQKASRALGREAEAWQPPEMTARVVGYIPVVTSK